MEKTVYVCFQKIFSLPLWKPSAFSSTLQAVVFHLCLGTSALRYSNVKKSFDFPSTFHFLFLFYYLTWTTSFFFNNEHWFLTEVIVKFKELSFMSKAAPLHYRLWHEAEKGSRPQTSSAVMRGGGS